MPFGAFLPKEYGFFDFFEQHAAKCVQGAKMLEELMDDFRDVEARIKQIKAVESEADQITHHTVEMLHKTFITPLDRDEIYGLICGLDDILDYIEATSARIAIYDIRTMTTSAKELARTLTKATLEVQAGVGGLRTLKTPADILKRCVDINRLENEADVILRNALADLFRNPGSNPLEVIKWKDVYENLEAATDRCEDVANVIEGVVLEHG